MLAALCAALATLLGFVYAQWWIRVNCCRRKGEPPFHRAYVPLVGCGVALGMGPLQFLRHYDVGHVDDGTYPLIPPSHTRLLHFRWCT